MKATLLCGLAWGVLTSVPAYAQSNADVSNTLGDKPAAAPQDVVDPAGTGQNPTPAAETVTDQDIVVTGIRASQRASLDVKRSASVIVDAITATDVGKFPDSNIADSLQRITGVAIDRSGGEGQFITVRGFGPQYNNVLVNGRTMATNSNGREFDFSTISSALISRAEVFKTSQAQLQEGGIGATVNIVTARPLDGRTGLHVAAHAGGIYDLLAKKATPDAGFVANYKNADSTFGLEASLNFTQRKSFDDQARVEGYFAVAPNSNTVSLINGTPSSTGLTPAAYSFLNAGGTRDLFVPQAYDNWRAEINQKRLTANLTAQYQPSDDLLVSVDAIYSRFNIARLNNFYKSFFVQPYFNDIKFDSNGTIASFTRPGRNFFAANPLLAADPRSVPQQSDNIVQLNDRKAESYQFGGNVKWTASDALKFEADLSHSRATTDTDIQGIVLGNYLRNTSTFSLVPGEKIPNFTLNETPTLQDITNHYSEKRFSEFTDDLTEARLQGEWAIDRGILKSVNFGGFYSRRQKQDEENFTPGTNFCAYCGYETRVDPSLLSVYPLNNFLPNSSGSSGVQRNFFVFNLSQVYAYQSQAATLNSRTPGAQANLPTAVFLNTGGFEPQPQRGEGFDVTERVIAGFVNTNFRGESWSGNIGVRVAKTRTSSSGSVLPVTAITPNPGDSSLLVFTYGPLTPVTIKNDYTDVLPSANLKIDATRTVVLRLAASRTITRPTLSDLGPNNAFSGRVTQPLSSGGNPLLQPFKAWNFDASAEWYATSDIAFTADVFRKEFSGFLSNQTTFVPRNGTTVQGNPVVYNFADTRPRNGNKGHVNGAEVAANYSFPRVGILSGFGFGANYTRVTSSQKVVSPGDCSQIEGLSKNSYNASAFYENHGLQARIAYNWRAKFLAVCQGLQGKPENTDSYGQTDFNIAYDVTPNFQVYLEGVNITNSYNYQYSVYKSRILLDQSTGRRLLAGVRAKF